MVNAGQVPVLTVDQPLYTVAKQIQWNWPNKFGESKFVVVLGALHVEMAVLKTIGEWLQWLDGSGWVAALVTAGITSSGRGESMLHASHVMRSWHAHQVTAASLYILQQRAWDGQREIMMAFGSHLGPHCLLQRNAVQNC